MFTWSAENVLAALDAGIREVAEVYNASHTFIHRRNPLAIGRHAHIFAMDATIAWLNQIEDERLVNAAVDAVLAA